MQSPSWQDSVFILTWDEFGGFYDHVPPQKAVSPDGIKPNDLMPGDYLHKRDWSELRLRLYRLSSSNDGDFTILQEELRFAYRRRLHGMAESWWKPASTFPASPNVMPRRWI